MPLFAPPLPAPFSLVSQVGLTGGSGTVTAGAAFFYGVPLYANVIVHQMRTWFNAAPSGNCDMGIYDATGANNKPGNLLGHTGAIAAVAGIFTQVLTADLPLSPGQYWLAFLSTAANGIPARGVNAAGMDVFYVTTATNLTVLTTVGALTTTTNSFAFEALMLNSYS